MANRVSLNIDIGFGSNAKVSKDLQSVLDYAKKNSKLELTLDTENMSKSLKEMNTAISNIQTQLKNINSGNISVVPKDTKTGISDMNKLAISMEKVNQQSIIASKERDKAWQNKNANAINKSLDEQYSKQMKLNELVGNMQKKLNTTNNNKFIDSSVIDNLQKKLNSLNTDSSTKEINELKTAIANLSSQESSIVRLQNAISKMESKLNGIKGAKSGVIDVNAISQVKAYEKELTNLKILLDQTVGGQSISSAKLSSELNKATSSTRDLDNALKSTSKSTTTFGTAFSNMAKSFGIMSVSFMAINQLRQSFREGMDAVLGMDSAINTLRITMNGMTETGLANMVSESQNMATDLSSTSLKVMEAVKTFANASETIDSIMNKTSSAIILSNLTGLDTSVTVDTIQSATKQFEDLSDGTEASAMKVTDSMVAISKALGMDFSQGVAQMSESVKILGSLSDQVGLDLDETLGLISSGMEKMRISGSEYATAMKTIISRTYRIKDADPNASEEDYLKAEKALSQQGIAIRKNNGEMVDYMDLVRNIAVEWETMNQQEQMALGDALGGARQLSIVLSSIKNMPRTEELIGIGKSSNGAGMEAQLIWAEGLEARLQSLTNTTQVFWQNFINSDALKGGISLLDGIGKTMVGLQGTFGSTALAMGVLSMAFLAFTNNPLKAFSKGLVDGTASTTSLGVKLKTLSTTFTTTKASMGGLSAVTTTASTGFKMLGTSALFAQVKVVALQVAMSLGLSLAITAAISIITKLCSSLSDTSSLMDGTSESATALANSLKDMDNDTDIVSQYEKLNNKLKDANNTAEEQKQIQSEIATIKNQLSTDESYGWIINSNKSLEEQLELMRQVRDEKIRGQAIELEDNMPSQRKVKKEVVNLDYDIRTYDNLVKAMENVDSQGRVMFEGSSLRASDLQDRINELEGEIKSSSLSIEEYNANLELMDRAGVSHNRTAIEFTDIQKQTRDAINKSTEELNANTEAKSKNANAGSSTSNPTSEGVSEVDNTAIIEARNLYNQALVNVNMLKGAVEELNTEQALTPETLQKILAVYPDLESKIGNMTDLQDALNEKVAEESKIRQDNYVAMGAYDSEAIPKAIEEYNKLDESATAVNDIIKRMNEEQGYTPQIMGEVLAMYPELSNSISDSATVQEFLNNKVAEMAETANSAYLQMMGDDELFYANKFLNNEEWQESFRESLIGMGISQTDAYNFDLSNFTTLNQLKDGILSQFGGSVNAWLSQFVDTSISGYNIDVNNFRSSAEAKARILDALNSEIAKVNANMAKAGEMALFASQQQKLLAHSPGSPKGKLDAYMFDQSTAQVEAYANQLKSLNGAIDQVNTSFGSMGASMSGFAPGGSFGTGNIGGGSGGKKPTGGGGSKDKEVKEKEVALIEDLSDRYHTLNNNLNDYNVLIEENKNLQQLATGADLQKLLAEEINLLEKKKQATKALMEEEKKARDEIKNSAKMNEFGYDADGDITNFNQIMNQKREYAKKLSGEERETYQNYIKDLEKTAREYENLNSKVEEHRNELNSLDVAMKNSAESMLMDVRDKWVQAKKQQLEQEKKGEITALDERIEALKKQISDLDDEEGDRKKKLAKLQAEREKWSNDDSVLGRKKIKELDQQINDLQKEITKDELQSQIDEIEKTKEGIEGNYETMLDEKKLYGEIDKLLTEGNMQSIIDTILAFEDDFKGLGNLLGTSISDAIKLEVDNAMKALDLLKNQVNNFKPPTTGGSGGSTSNPSTSTGGDGTPKPVGKGSKVKVLDPNSDIYVDSYTNSSSGSWRGAGVSSSDSLYVVNDNNGSVALSRTNSINDAIGWIKKNKVQAFMKGGVTPDGLGEKGALGILHSTERVLTKEQTLSFEKLVNMLPSISKMMGLNNIIKTPDYSKILNEGKSSGDTTISNVWEITNNTPMDVVKTEKTMTNIMKAELRKFGKIK